MHSDIRDASTIRDAFRYQGIPPLESVTMYIYTRNGSRYSRMDQVNFVKDSL